MHELSQEMTPKPLDVPARTLESELMKISGAYGSRSAFAKKKSPGEMSGRSLIDAEKSG